MTEFLWIMTYVVPAGRIELSDLSQHLFSVDRSEVLLLGDVGRVSKSNLTLDDRDGAITQPNFVSGIDNSAEADGCRVGQTVCKHIGERSNSGVVAAGEVILERRYPAGGVEVAGGVAEERIEPAGGVA